MPTLEHISIPTQQRSDHQPKARDAQAPDSPSISVLDMRRRQLRAALVMLFAVFDEAQARANRRRLAEGRPDLIARETRESERLYSEAGYHGSLRTLSLFPALPVADAHLFGGVYVTHTGVRAAIYLVPALELEPIHWSVQRTGHPFTARDADDLFLAVFDEDAEASKRLAPLHGVDLFVTPWS
jgi:hypothetical protein